MGTGQGRLKLRATGPMAPGDPSRPDRPVKLTLSLPPTVNQYLNPVVYGRNARMIVSRTGRQYAEEVAWEILKQRGSWYRPLAGPLRVTITVHFGNRRKQDIDNRVKPLLDALTLAQVWGDDSQIDDLHVLRGEVRPRQACVEVVVEVIA